MLRTRAEQVSWWESVLPAEVLRLPEELARVDALLDDPAFFAPFAPHLHPVLGRPSTPVELTFTASSGLTPLFTSGSAAHRSPDATLASIIQPPSRSAISTATVQFKTRSCAGAGLQRICNHSAV